LARVSRRIGLAARAIRASSAAWWAMASVPAMSLVEFLVLCLGLAQHLGVRLLRQPGGEAVGRTRHFVRQLEEIGDALGIQLAAFHRRAHRAAGFLRMLAVAEAALLRQRFDV